MMWHAPFSRLLAAASLSVMLHAALMSASWLQPPKTRPHDDLPLQVEMVRMPPVTAPPTGAKPVPPPATKSALRARAIAQRPKSGPVLPAPAAAETAPRIAADPEPVQYAEERSEPQPESPPTETAPAEPTRQRVPVQILPRKGRIAYTMYYGDDAFTVGKTVQTWEAEEGGYRLGSVSETTGIVELFGAQRHIYLSEGRLTPRGLQPEKFFMSRTRRGRTEAAQARFDWETGTLSLGKVRDQHSAALAPAAQDIVSFMYQLGLSPPAPGRIRLPVTNGSSFKIYDLDVLDEEKIETPLGILKALPVKQVPQPGDESIELWLAVEYRYLPVRLRFFDREGKPTGEQLVNEIRISDE